MHLVDPWLMEEKCTRTIIRVPGKAFIWHFPERFTIEQVSKKDPTPLLLFYLDFTFHV